jgi:very-short-patch-repair endonuclease
VDFFCADPGLCIEVNGAAHAEPARPEYDAARTAWLAQLGCRVIRSTNGDVFGNLAGVLEAIRPACPEEGAKGAT